MVGWLQPWWEYVTAKDKRERKKEKSKGKKEMKGRRERGMERKRERREEQEWQEDLLLEDIEIGKMGIVNKNNRKSKKRSLPSGGKALAQAKKTVSKIGGVLLRRVGVSGSYFYLCLLFNPLRSPHLPAHPPNQPSACPPPQGNLGLLIIIRSKQTLGHT